MDSILIFFIGTFFGKLIRTLTIYFPENIIRGKSNFFRALQYRSNFLLLEIGVGFFFTVSYMLFGMNLSLLFILLTGSLLICCFITDFEHRILPNEFTFTLIGIGLGAACIPIFVTLKEAFAGAILGYGLFWLINIIFRQFKGYNGIFPGDLKLNAGIGACVGYKLVIPVIFLSMIILLTMSLAFAALRKFEKNWMRKEIPYGCFSSIVTLVFCYSYLVRKIS